MPITVNFYAYHRKFLCLLSFFFIYINTMRAGKTRLKTKKQD